MLLKLYRSHTERKMDLFMFGIWMTLNQKTIRDIF